MNENFKQADELAQKILKLSRNTLLVNMRFLDVAISKLEFVSDNTTFSTDGKSIYYGVKHVFDTYKLEKNLVLRDYMHMILHCIFRHNFVTISDSKQYWDLATDIAVENIINELGLDCCKTSKALKQNKVIDELKSNLKTLNAEKIYRYYLDKNLDSTQLDSLRSLFQADDHTIWYNPHSNINSMASKERLEQEWKEVSERIQVDIETASKGIGKKSSSMLQELNELNREKYDYSSFLKKFAVMGETMKINDDEFDYIFYTYGLKLYDTMPLVEPLEYKEVKLIKDFVIAIDTSGSVSGELVQKFIQKTYNILKSTESFFSKINLYIIQCDAQIQGIAKITSQKDFDAYIQNMVLQGFGGTDFRPVFKFVDSLVKNGEFEHLKGLIYFTDGYGTFPSKKPEYDVAFAFLRSSYDNPQVPPWAIKLIFEDNEF